MTNFEPKKLPPLGPPGRKAPPAKTTPTPPVAVPQPSNLPPKIGNRKLPTPPPVNRPAPAAPQHTAPKVTPTQQPPVAPPMQPAPVVQQQPYYEEPQHAQPQQTWEETYAAQHQQQQMSQDQYFQQPAQQQQSPFQGQNQGYNNEPQSGWGRQETPRPQAEEEEVEEEEEEVPTKKGRKASKAASKKSKKPVKKKKPNEYAGSRSKLLMTRMLLFGTVGILVAAGVYSFVPKASYLTANDQNVIISKVRENLGETYFPTEAGEGWARGFLNTYLNYTPEIAEERKKQLLTYTTEEVLKSIDISFLTEVEMTALTNKEDATVEDLEAIAGITDTKTQLITDGPYLIKKELLPGGNIGIFSYKVQINGADWSYIEVPVYYNMEKRGLSISGTPTFRSIIPISKPPISNRETLFENDRDVSARIEKDIKAYLQAWVSSDQTGIDRYLVKEGGANAVTPQASTGLGGSVDFLSLDKITVETKILPKNEEDLTAEVKADFNKRYVVANIRVIEPTSGIIYRQNYQLVIEYVNENWFVQDIRNMVVFADSSEEK